MGGVSARPAWYERTEEGHPPPGDDPAHLKVSERDRADGSDQRRFLVRGDEVAPVREAVREVRLEEGSGSRGHAPSVA